MSLFERESLVAVTCPRGNEPLLAGELRALGYGADAQAWTGVETRGSLSDAMVLNLELRTAHRVLYLLDAFEAQDPDALYRRVVGFPWEDVIPAEGRLCVRSSVDTPTIRDARFANLRCKDAIVDRMRSVLGLRPDSGPDPTGTVINLYWKGEACKVYLDTSGVPVSQRGYRRNPGKAPLREATAAGVVLSTGWQGQGAFVNPMCGSGTLAVEAAWIALGRPPGLLRDNFGFMHVLGFDPGAWEGVRRSAKSSSRRSFPGRIIATDRDARALDAAVRNAATAGVDHRIEFRRCPFEDTEVPPGGGVIVLNPEYGERLGRVESLEGVYRAIGDFFKQRGTGYAGFVFTGSPPLAKKVGLRARRRRVFYNGPIECRLLEYELYAGSRRGDSGGGAGSAGTTKADRRTPG